ncbi:MAG: redoxin domain-containing protein [Bacteroidales bacterium]|nr:redoxin domain-containing protein [Bacteroidales bacterium]
MRNIAIIVSILFALFTSCTEENIKYYSINGSGVASGDTLYLYGLDRRYEFMDTIIANNEGSFRYEIYADTIFPLSLIMPTGEALVLYAEPYLEATIFPDSTQQAHTDSIQPTPMDSVHHSLADSVQKVITDSVQQEASDSIQQNISAETQQKKWLISGGKLQQEYDSMAARMEGLSPEQRYEEIDSFVRRNPMSEANIMLLRRYIVEAPSPSNRYIREILNNLGGKLNDNDYIKEVRKLLEDKRSASTIIYSSMPSFNYKSIDDSTKILNSRYKNKFLVINFWASWDTLSCKHVKEMGSLIDKHRKDTLMMLNISLDHDTAQWRKKVLSDTILGDNVCDLKMWDNNLVKRYGVSNLPYSILVNPKSLNISFNTTPEKLNASLDSIIDVYKKEKKKEEKEKRERERKKRRKNKK